MERRLIEAVRQILFEVNKLTADDLLLSGMIKPEDLPKVKGSLQKSAEHVLNNALFFIEPVKKTK